MKEQGTKLPLAYQSQGEHLYDLPAMNSDSEAFQKKVKANGKHNVSMPTACLLKDVNKFKAGVNTILETSLPKRIEMDCLLQQLCFAEVEGN